jgi:hypothetical protein
MHPIWGRCPENKEGNQRSHSRASIVISRASIVISRASIVISRANIVIPAQAGIHARHAARLRYS